jgi:hypothetical protein
LVGSVSLISKIDASALLELQITFKIHVDIIQQPLALALILIAEHKSSCGNVGALMPSVERAEALPHAVEDPILFLRRDIGSKSAAVFAMVSPRSLNSQIEKRSYPSIYLLFLPGRIDGPCL